MADGSKGGLGGVLFEAGKSAVQATGNTVKQQVQQIGNAAAGQLGAQKPLFGGTQKSSGTFNPKPLGGLNGQLPKDPLGNFGDLFKGGKPGFGPKQPLIPPAPQFTQEDLDKMAAENAAKDQAEIAKKQAELKQLQQQLHDENYYAEIRDVGKDSIQKERDAKAKVEEEEQLAKDQQVQQANQLPDLSNNMTGNNPPLGEPVAVTQSKTQREAHRGTTG